MIYVLLEDVCFMKMIITHLKSCIFKLANSYYFNLFSCFVTVQPQTLCSY